MHRVISTKRLIIKLVFLFLIKSVAAQNNTIKTINRINNYLLKSEQNGFSGAVLIAKENKVLLSKGFGFSDKTKQIKNTPNTVFDIGSVTKQFTAAAILKLEEQGKLKVTNSISIYFDNVPNDKKNITIHQLLTHTAGFIHDVGESDFDMIPTNEYFKLVMSSKLLFIPGEKFEYTNVGYSLLARIIELVSKQPYETYLNKNLFEPLKMFQTGYLLPKWNDNSIAKGYMYNVIDKGTSIDLHKNNRKVSWCLKGNGGIQSTQKDMFKWYKALGSNKILSELSVAKLTRPYVLEYEGGKSYYAYGWAIFNSIRNTKMIAHDGSDGTFFYDFRWFPEEKITILYATNAFSRNVQNIAWEVDKMLFNKKYEPKEVKVYIMTTLLHFTKNYKGKLTNLGQVVNQKYGKQLNHPFYLNRMTGIYLQKKAFEKALQFAKLNVKLFPKEANNWDTLGEVYYKIGDITIALECYQKALKLDPEIMTAEKMIKKIKKEMK